MLSHDRQRLLLGRKKEWPKSRYSCLAGFIEAGEAAEAAAFFGGKFVVAKASTRSAGLEGFAEGLVTCKAVACEAITAIRAITAKAAFVAWRKAALLAAGSSPP